MPQPKKELRDFSSESVTPDEAAKFLKLSRRTFYRLIESGDLPKSNDGEYILGEIVEAYWRSQFDNKGLLAAKTRLTTAAAEINELKLSQERGEVVKSSAVMKVWCDNVIRAKTKLLNIPTKIAPELVGQDVTEIQSRLTNEIEQALKELAEYNVDAIKRVEV